MKKTLMGLVAGGVMMAMAPMQASADCGEVVMTEMTWPSATVVTAISKFLMEQGYGCSVKTISTSGNPAVTSVAETGRPDIVTEVWVNTVPTYRELEEQGKIVTVANVLSDGGEEGFWVPKYMVDENPELATIEGILANADAVGGRFHNCPDGWSCKIVNDHLAKVLDMEGKGIEVFTHGSGETLATSIASAYADKAPWFGYYWAPTSLLGKYPMVKVDLGPVNPVAYACMSDPNCTDAAQTSYPVSDVITGVTTDFGTKNPSVMELMTNVSFTNYQMGEVLAWMDDNKASADEAAVYFLNNYKDVWTAWLNDEARTKLSALIN